MGACCLPYSVGEVGVSGRISWGGGILMVWREGDLADERETVAGGV